MEHFIQTINNCIEEKNTSLSWKGYSNFSSRLLLCLRFNLSCSSARSKVGGINAFVNNRIALITAGFIHMQAAVWLQDVWLHNSCRKEKLIISQSCCFHCHHSFSSTVNNHRMRAQWRSGKDTCDPKRPNQGFNVQHNHFFPKSSQFFVSHTSIFMWDNWAYPCLFAV